MSRVEVRGAPARVSVVVCAFAAACGACDGATRGAPPSPETASPADLGGGGPGTRAKGEDDTMGKPSPAPREAQGFGILGPQPAASAAATATAMAPGNWPAPPPADPTTTTAPAAHLDPNARYATTYRPGGAALAAFDSAVARGQIPATYKDLVGDFGARYAPAIERPTEGALAIAVDTGAHVRRPRRRRREPPRRRSSRATRCPRARRSPSTSSSTPAAR